MKQAIISLKPRYANLILSGKKSVELRNRIVRLEPGTKIWIYATRPVGRIVAFAKVKAVDYGEPTLIWKQFKKKICIEKTEFNSYTEDRKQVSAVTLTRVRELTDARTEALSLDGIRGLTGTFHPPQFYAYLRSENELFEVLNGIPRSDIQNRNGTEPAEAESRAGSGRRDQPERTERRGT